MPSTTAKDSSSAAATAYACVPIAAIAFGSTDELQRHRHRPCDRLSKSGRREKYRLRVRAVAAITTIINLAAGRAFSNRTRP